MNISLSGLNKMQSIKKAHYSVISSPNWEIIPCKGMQVPSKDELIKQIKELATKRAQAVTDDDFTYINHQEAKLSACYLSSVSPDRKSLYKEAVQTIKSQKKNQAYSEGEKTLLDYLNEKDGFTVTSIYNSRGGYDYNINVGPNIVMSYSQGLGGWTFTMTPAELQKRKEFNKIFDDTYYAAKSQHPIVADKNFDMKA